MPYPELMVTPMREELVRLGVQELKTADDVQNFLADKSGSAMIVINSVCGCAAGAARPAVALALEHETKPDRLATVFAGQDTEATQAVREAFPEAPPSSPSIMVVKDGKLAEYVPRHQIEGRDARAIADDLANIFESVTA